MTVGGIGWMHRCSRIWQKLMAIALSFTIPLALMTYFLLDEKNIKIHFTENELRGNEYVRPLSRLLVKISLHDRLSGRQFAGPGSPEAQLQKTETEIDVEFARLLEVDRKLGQSLKTSRRELAERDRLGALPADLEAQWEALRAGAPDLRTGELAHASLLGNLRTLIRHVGDTSQLILDPDLDTYYTMEALLLREPELIDGLSQVGDAVEQMLARGVTEGDRAALAVSLALVKSEADRMASGLATAFVEARRHSRSETLEPTLAPLLERALDGVSNVADVTTREIVRAAAPEVDMPGYASMIDGAIEANAQLWTALSDQEDKMLRVRRDGDLGRRRIALGTVLAALGFAAALTLLVARRISRKVGAVARAAEQLAAGDLTRRVEVGGHDEVGAMAAAFNSMAERLQGRAEAERLILETANDAYVAMDEDGCIIEWNHQAEEVFGWSREEVLGAPLAETVIPSRYREAHERGLRHFLATGEGPVLFQRLELSAVRRDGEEFPVELTIWPTRTDRGFSFNAFMRDVTERKAAQEADRRKTTFLELLETVAVAANEATGVDAAFTTCVDQVCSRVGWPVGHVYVATDDRSRLDPTSIWHLEDGRFEAFRSVTEATPLPSGIGLPGRVLASGRPAWVIDVTRDPNFPRAPWAEQVGLRAGFAFPVMVGTDVVAVLEFFSPEAHVPDDPLLEVMANIGTQLGRVMERQRAQEALAHQALHDPLTGLPNRALFVDRLTHALARLERNPSGAAVLFLDLDGFKVINDSLGHEAGDELLVAVATRLGGSIRPADTLARFGGDEFTILLEDLGAEHEATAVVERIMGSLVAPFSLRGQDIVITTSIGIAFARHSMDGAESLIRDADAAMYRAKELGRARCEIFDVAIHQRAAERLETQNSLRRAVAAGQLRLHYQPQISLANGRITGVEALVRWQHPHRGLLLPSQFIPLAEESQLIVDIGNWVIEEACRQAARWRHARPGEAPLRMCVNVSARQLTRPELVDVVARAIEESGIEAGSLCLEITESALMGDVDFYLESMLALKSLGVSVGIDDFGTGYSSLAYLKRFPVDVLKIDKTFIDGLDKELRAEDIVGTVVNLAHALGLLAIAEGVETVEQAAALARLRCDEAQGYHFARPGPAEQVSGLMRSLGAAAFSATTGG